MRLCAAVDAKALVEEHREEILEVARRHGATSIRLFGSVATGHHTNDSDIDLLVELEEGRSLLDHVALKQELEDLLGVDVDVVTPGGLHWSIRDRVLQQAVEV